MLVLPGNRFNIYIFTDGTARIDGGSMFGIVPKILWNKYYSADRKNRILIVMACMLIEVKDKNKKILVDTGIGNKFDKKFVKIYKINKKLDMINTLKQYNTKPEDINIVINTHLHFDHCGYNTVYDDATSLKPMFTKAKYIVQKKEWEYALSPDIRSKPSYWEENFLPLEKTKQVELVDGDVEIEKGIKLIFTGGHSVGHQSVLIEDEGKKIFFTGDLVPTAYNVKINYTSGFDLFPLELMKKKQELLTKAQQEGWSLVFPHDASFPYATVAEVYSEFFNKK